MITMQVNSGKEIINALKAIKLFRKCNNIEVDLTVNESYCFLNNLQNDEIINDRYHNKYETNRLLTDVICSNINYEYYSKNREEIDNILKKLRL